MKCLALTIGLCALLGLQNLANARPRPLCVGPDGSAYRTTVETGTLSGATYLYHLLTLKLDKSGSGVDWWWRYDSPVPLVANSITLDTSGNVYVVGTEVEDGGETNDLELVKYASNGQFQWISGWSIDTYTQGLDVVIGPNGNPFVIGYTSPSTTSATGPGLIFEFAASNGASMGGLEWTYPSASNTRFTSGFVDSSGFLYLSGIVLNDANGVESNSCFVTKLSFATGGTLWLSPLYASQADWNTNDQVLLNDNNEPVLVFPGAPPSSPITVEGYSSSGTNVLNESVGKSPTLQGAVNPILGATFDPSGNVYVSTETQTGGSITGIQLTKFPATGSGSGGIYTVSTTYPGVTSYLPLTLNNDALAYSSAGGGTIVSVGAIPNSSGEHVATGMELSASAGTLQDHEILDVYSGTVNSSMTGVVFDPSTNLFVGYGSDLTKSESFPLDLDTGYGSSGALSWEWVSGPY